LNHDPKLAIGVGRSIIYLGPTGCGPDHASAAIAVEIHFDARDGRKNESMPLPPEEKAQIIKDFARKEGDSGSPEVQIALLTARIKQVATHLRENKGDVHNRRGLVMMVSKRDRLLRYLSKKDHNAYLDTIKRLGLRK